MQCPLTTLTRAFPCPSPYLCLGRKVGFALGHVPTPQPASAALATPAAPAASAAAHAAAASSKVVVNEVVVKGVVVVVVVKVVHLPGVQPNEQRPARFQGATHSETNPAARRQSRSGGSSLLDWGRQPAPLQCFRGDHNQDVPIPSLIAFVISHSPSLTFSLSLSHTHAHCRSHGPLAWLRRGLARARACLAARLSAKAASAAAAAAAPAPQSITSSLSSGDT